VLKTYPKPRHSGFSLVELMIGIVVLGIIMSVAIPSFKSLVLNTRVRNAAESVLSGIQHARAEAITRNTNIEFTLLTDTSWNIDYPAAYKTANSLTADPPLSVKAANEGSKNVTLAAKATDAVTAASRVTFTNLGQVLSTNADGSLQLAEINFSIPDGNRPLRVVIGVQTTPGTPPYVGSNPKMCDPSIAPPNLLAC
jgi:type IV fimbrial biogenesis protein FimT